MPKFTLPAKKPKKDKAAAVGMPVSDYHRKVHIPVNNEILQALDINDEATVTLAGKVCELSKHESPDYKDMHIALEISSVEAYPNTKDKAQKDFKRGFKKAKAYS